MRICLRKNFGNKPLCAAANIPLEGPTTHELTSPITPKAIISAITLTNHPNDD